MQQAISAIERELRQRPIEAFVTMISDEIAAMIEPGRARAAIEAAARRVITAWLRLEPPQRPAEAFVAAMHGEIIAEIFKSGKGDLIARSVVRRAIEEIADRTITIWLQDHP